MPAGGPRFLGLNGQRYYTQAQKDAADAAWKETPQYKAEQQRVSVRDTLRDQILAQGTTDKWSGEGFGSPQANASSMADILTGIGITNINQFGEIPTYQKLEIGGYTDSGKPIYGTNVKVPQINGDLEYFTQSFIPADESQIVMDNGVPSIKTGTKYGNKVTGQVVPNTYSERQTGNAWGGTFAGDGNTGYRVQFDQNGNPYFYTTAASSNDLANLLGDNPILNVAANIAAATFGGPLGSAALQLAQGKDIEDAAKAAVTSYVGGQIASGVSPEISNAFGGGTTGNIAANAITGGTMAELQGGDFLQGAIQGGISGGINEAKLAAAEDYLQSVEPGGYDSSIAPTELDVINAFPELAPPVAIDTSFTPDYSLASSSPVLPDMGAQGIQVPTINEVIDVVNQPVDYSLPIPDAGIGLVANQPAPVLGNPESFINQPAPNVEVKIPDVVAAQPEDISGKLALLDTAKALAPAAVGALLANEVLGSSSDTSSGYPIVPIPPEWMSPEYSQAFTASAPVDFGTRELLKGTQWENPAVQPMNISNLVNTLNNQYMPMNSLPQVSTSQKIGSIGGNQMSIDDIIASIGRNNPQAFNMNQTIGQLNNAPASLASIISGIQSQYG